MTTTLVTGNSGWHHFKATSDKPITKDEALTHQFNHGYPAGGYGFYAFQTVTDGNGGFSASWKCSSSCE